MECVADAMAWRPRHQVQARIIRTLQSLNNQTPGFKTIRAEVGWFHDNPFQDNGQYELLGNGLVMMGILFAKRYYTLNDPGSEATRSIVQLADDLWHSVHYEELLCDSKIENGTQVTKVSQNGTYIPMVQSSHEPRHCIGAQAPGGDGYYTFDEEHYTIDLAYRKGCNGQPLGQCKNKALETMWQKWQGRRLHMNQHYADGNQTYDILSAWSGYIVHLPFYTSYSFNSDSAYQHAFHAHWKVDWLFYNSSTHQGERGRYGMGAGPTPNRDCNGGSGYFADRLNDLWPCRMYSPYVVAGYLPAAQDIIKPQLLNLMEDGETVLPLSGSDAFVLWRKSMIYEGFTQGYGVTLVDFASELWGLSTLWLGVDFYTNYSNHFENNDAQLSSVIV